MAEAKRALEELSRDPRARRIAEARREALVMNHLDRAQARREGREEGRYEGRREGRREGREEGARLGLRRAVDKFCETSGIVVDDARRAWLDLLAADELEATLGTLFATRRFP